MSFNVGFGVSLDQYWPSIPSGLRQSREQLRRRGIVQQMAIAKEKMKVSCSWGYGLAQARQGPGPKQMQLDLPTEMFLPN